MEKIIKVLMKLIKSVICDTDVDITDKLTDEEEQKLYDICKDHSISTIIGEALSNYDVIRNKQIKNMFMNASFSSVFDYERLKADIDIIVGIFEEEKIPYIKLKGPRIRNYYPKPWLRTSGDIDILVHEEDVARATKVLSNKAGFKEEKYNYHDVPMESPNGSILELHFSIKENMPNLDKVLEKVWKYSFPAENDKESMEYKQSNEFFLFHLIAHMAYHFQHGGCGIRSVIDIYLIRKQMNYDEDIVIEFCKEAGIERFYKYLTELTKVWFENKAYDNVTSAMEEFIISGGTFGTDENSISVQQNIKGGHKRYIKSKIFATYDHLSGQYPGLSKHKHLIFIYQVKRWIDMVKDGKFKRYIKEYNISKNMSKNKLNTTEKLLKELGIL